MPLMHDDHWPGRLAARQAGEARRGAAQVDTWARSRARAHQTDGRGKNENGSRHKCRRLMSEIIIACQGARGRLAGPKGFVAFSLCLALVCRVGGRWLLCVALRCLA